MSKWFIIVLFTLASMHGASQNANIDTLLHQANELLYADTKKSIEISEKVIQLKITKKQQFSAYYTLGDCYYLLGEFDTSLKNYYQCQKIAEELKDEFLLSKSFLGIGTVYDDNGDADKGLSLYFKALSIREKLGNKKDISSVLNNIAVSYYKQDKIEKAIEYMYKCVSIDQELDDSSGLGYSYSNLGSFLYFNDQNDSAIYYHSLALKIRQNLGEPMQTARSLNNIANAYVEKGDINLAIDYYNEAVDIKRELDNPYELGNGLTNLGITLSNHDRPKEALPVLLEAQDIMKEFDNKSLLKDNMYALAKTYAGLKMMDSAYALLKRTYVLSKEIFNETKSEQIEEMVAKFETEKTEKENEELKAQRAIAALENEELRTKQAQDALTMEKSKTRNYLLFGSLLIVILIALMIFLRLKANRKTTTILKDLNNELAEKNSDITDSILYAKKIQQALLPNKAEFTESFNDAFVLFMPRDIVSGDFYWIQKQESTIYFAVADCTGHGVPGSFVSILCNNLLGHAVNEHGLNKPGDILEDVNDGIIKRLRKENSTITMMDGMDISLGAIDTKTNLLQFSGAMNPILICRNNSLTEYKGTKESIGGVNHGKSFETHQHQLEKGDIIYLFSDGFQDQFGGEKGKKFKYKNFKEVLLKISNSPLADQENILKQEHLIWKGDLEQLDDICVMGIKI